MTVSDQNEIKPVRGSKVSVVCPFFNESSVIAASAEKLISSLEGAFSEWELILVNDGSTDDSLERLSVVVEGNSDRVKVLGYERNMGRGHALKAGIDAACYDIVVTTEMDGSWGSDIVTRLVSVLCERPDMDFVIASPHLPGGGLVNVPLKRRILSRYGNWIIQKFFDSNISMNTGMTRAYRRHVIQPLVTMEFGKEFHLEVLLKLLALGFSFTEMPATITWPEGRAKKRQTRATAAWLFRTSMTHIRFTAIAQPAKYFAAACLLMLVLGVGFFIAAVWQLLTSGVSVFLAMIGILFLLFAVLFLGFAVMFTQFREFALEQWMRPYNPDLPPSRRQARRVSAKKN